MTPDGSDYLLLGSNLISGEGYDTLKGFQTTRGPVLPGLLGGLMLLFGRDTESLAWIVRLLALANPLLMYSLIKRTAGPFSALLAAAVVALFSYTTILWHAFNLDAVQLTVYLLAVLTLLIAAQRNAAGFSLLSGIFLGTAILTKETSCVGLPLALFAALLLGWSFRGVLLHYAGVVMVCLPWWVWVWTASGQVYLLGRMPSGWVVPLVAALVLITLFVVVGLYKFGMIGRLLADDRRRRRVGWFVVLASTTVLSALLLSISRTFLGLGEGDTLSATLASYFEHDIRPYLRLWYLLPFAGIFILREALRGNRLWSFYLALLVLQMPIALLIFAERYDTRQWLILQTLLYGGLAGLMAKVFGALIRSEKHNLRRAVAFGAAAVLVAVLAWTGVAQVQYLRREDANTAGGKIQNNWPDANNPSVRDMQSWVAQNVPEREKIITTQNYSAQLAYLDGMQHEWTLVQLDCAPGPDYSASGTCGPGGETTQASSQPMIWFKMDKDCDGRALTFTTLVRQMELSGATYLLATQEYESAPNNLAWAPYINSNGAFEPIYSSYLPDAPSGKQVYGLVMLKRTGRDPAPAPTQMDTLTTDQLIRCEQRAWGEEYAEKIRSAFPNGIEVVGNQPEVDSARSAVARIYER